MGDASRGAERDGECISNIRRAGRFSESALHRHGGLHDLLGGVAVAGDGFLDFGRHEFIEFDFALRSCKEDDAARVAHEDACADVLVMREQLLNDDERGGEFIEELGEFFVKLREAEGHGFPGLESHDACFDEDGLHGAGVEVDAAVAGDLKPGIDADDAHGVRVVIGRSDAMV